MGPVCHAIWTEQDQRGTGIYWLKFIDFIGSQPLTDGIPFSVKKLIQEFTEDHSTQRPR
jgi:hypothetical protein